MNFPISYQLISNYTVFSFDREFGVIEGVRFRKPFNTNLRFILLQLDACIIYHSWRKQCQALHQGEGCFGVLCL